MVTKTNLNKRGQEGIGTGPVIVALVILVVLGVLVVLFITGTIGRGKEAAGQLPNEYSSAGAGCLAAVNAKTKIALCNQWRAIGNKRYVTCNTDGVILDYLFAQGKITAEEQLSENPFGCVTADAGEEAAVLCKNEINQADLDDVDMQPLGTCTEVVAQYGWEQGVGKEGIVLQLSLTLL